ncbi:MAG: tRNA (adenosine(37)-N6)-dimethylallyltransferase MiaA, partial [Phaeodactylibacter sp.]|nr:tRNA (adenosine(37)-N6)-dimethylallyltransferase MiaA [Phaeodactylibacter sp.]
FRALCEGLDHFPEVPEEIRAAVESDFQNGGLEVLQQELQKTDPVYYEEVDLQNPVRLIRALSVIRASGQAFSAFRKQEAPIRHFQPIYVLLEMDRAQLYERINLRVDRMVEAGLVEEARRVWPYRHKNALQTVGYQELFEYFEGRCSLERAIELIKQNSRRYAKRQGTWFRKRPHWQSFDPNDFTGIVNHIDQYLLSTLKK